MGSVLEEAADKAVKAYIEAVNRYRRLRDKYKSEKGRSEAGIEALRKELEEAEAAVNETLRNWNEALRRLLDAKR